MLRISADRRKLVQADGTPFFYLGDTAWELFHRQNREEAAEYLAVRAAQQFTVIQAVALAEFDGLRTPNPYGHVPFHDLDPTRPNEDYFQHVDWIVARAGALGLVVGFLPTWGDKVTRGFPRAIGPEVFDPDSARVYGRFLGQRYREQALIWILGGDRELTKASHLLTYRAMAEGIREGGARQPMTFHPRGGTSSSQAVHGEAWLDFNMIQSGHQGRDNPTWDMVELDLAKLPPKPTLDAEPNYEDHPVMAPGWKAAGEWFTDYDVRKQAYRSLLAGACGFTYGCHDIWQMWQPGREGVNHVRTPWRQALRLPGAEQMRHVRVLFASRDWLKLRADQALIRSACGTGGQHLCAARAEDNSYAYAYLPVGGAVTADAGRLGPRVRAGWFNPRDGSTQAAGTIGGTAEVSSPTGEDWVLVLEGAG